MFERIRVLKSLEAVLVNMSNAMLPKEIEEKVCGYGIFNIFSFNIAVAAMPRGGQVRTPGEAEGKALTHQSIFTHPSP